MSRRNFLCWRRCLFRRRLIRQSTQYLECYAGRHKQCSPQMRDARPSPVAGIEEWTGRKGERSWLRNARTATEQADANTAKGLERPTTRGMESRVTSPALGAKAPESVSTATARARGRQQTRDWRTRGVRRRGSARASPSGNR